MNDSEYAKIFWNWESQSNENIKEAQNNFHHERKHYKTIPITHNAPESTYWLIKTVT